LRKRNLIFLFCMVIMLSSTWPAMKVALMFVSPLIFLMQRCLLASMVLLPLIAFLNKKFPTDGRTWLHLFIYSIIIAIGMTMSTIGLVYETTGLSSLLTCTHPIFVFCLAKLFLKERVTPNKIFGMLLGLLGIIILYAERISFATRSISPILLLTSGAFLWAVSMVYFKKFLKNIDQLLVTCIQFFFVFIIIFAVTLMFNELTFPINPPILYILSLLYTSIVGMALAIALMLSILKEEETIVVSVSSLIVPVLATFFGWIFLHETVSFFSFLSFIFILAGIYLVNKER